MQKKNYKTLDEWANIFAQLLIPHYQKEDIKMEKEKAKKPFEAEIDGKKYTVKKCIKCTTKDGKSYLKPINDNDIVLGFVNNKNFCIGEVNKSNGSWFKQLLLLIAEKIENK